MNRICIHKRSGQVLQMQGGGKVHRHPRESFESDEHFAEYNSACDNLEAMRLDTLRRNALNAGYAKDEVEVRWVTEEEYETALRSQPFDRESWLNTTIRPKRNAMLDETDLKYCNAERWAAMTEEQQDAWRVYKQSLRDLPAIVDPENPVWPEMPG